MAQTRAVMRCGSKSDATVNASAASTISSTLIEPVAKLLSVAGDDAPPQKPALYYPHLQGDDQGSVCGWRWRTRSAEGDRHRDRSAEMRLEAPEDRLPPPTLRDRLRLHIASIRAMHGE